jgi:hypothetical protein
MTYGSLLLKKGEALYLLHNSKYSPKRIAQHTVSQDVHHITLTYVSSQGFPAGKEYHYSTIH